MSLNPTWHLLTGEYPDQPGGVADYTRIVARSLASAGEDVHVWAAAFSGDTPRDAGVTVHRLPGHFDLRSLRVLGATLNAWPKPSRLFIQYVPHAFGWKAMNVGLSHWLGCRRQPVWVMFHEIAYPWIHGQSIKQQVLGCANQYMARRVARAAQKIFVSSAPWKILLESLTRQHAPIEWLPVPSNIPTRVPPLTLRERSRRFGLPENALLLGHFGTYGESITRFLTPCLKELLRRETGCHFLLMGRGGQAFVQTLPDHGGRIQATGSLAPAALAECLASCDIMFQPYPDGISCRRATAMACLALGRPIVSTSGHNSESFWKDIVLLADSRSPEQLLPLVGELLANPSQRGDIGERSRQLYEERFSLERTMSVLLGRATATPFPQESQQFGPLPHG